MKSNSNWEITENRYVAYIDIMGFKDMVARTPHDEIYNMMKKIESSKRLAENMEWKKADSKLVSTTTYSDSIMLYSMDSKFESLYSLICSVASLSVVFN